MNLLLQLFLCGSFILGLLNNIYINTLNLLNVYRIPASAVILKTSGCFALRVEKCFEIAILVLFLCVRVLLCGLGWRSVNLLFHLFLCGSFILGLLNHIYINTLNSLNVYRIPASAVILKSSRCFAPRVEKLLRNRNSRTISLRQSVALRAWGAGFQSLAPVVSLL